MNFLNFAVKWVSWIRHIQQVDIYHLLHIVCHRFISSLFQRGEIELQQSTMRLSDDEVCFQRSFFIPLQQDS